MPDWILQILIVSIIVPALTFIGYQLKKIINAKIDAWLITSDIKQKEEIRVALTDAQNKLSAAVFSAVKETQETFVNNIKKTPGGFTRVAAAEAFRKSFERTKEIMSNAALEIIQSQTGNLDILIQNQIEALLPEVKATLEADKNTRSIGFWAPVATTPKEDIKNE